MRATLPKAPQPGLCRLRRRYSTASPVRGATRPRASRPFHPYIPPSRTPVYTA